MTRSEHIAEHRRLHQALDQLLADYLAHHFRPGLPVPVVFREGDGPRLSVAELARWAARQAVEPDPLPGCEHDPEPSP